MSDSPRDEFINRFKEDMAHRQETAVEDAFETERVRFILNRFNLGRKWEIKLRERHRHYSGQPLLRFSTFHEVFPTFPIVLAATRLGGVRLHVDERCLVPNLFRSFRSAPFWQAYQDLYEQQGDTLEPGQSLGLVFPFKGIRQGLVTYLGEKETWSVGLTLTYTIKAGHDRLVVQPFQVLIDAIHARGRGWKPEPRL